jgi:hypothetical protein
MPRRRLTTLNTGWATRDENLYPEEKSTPPIFASVSEKTTRIAEIQPTPKVKLKALTGRGYAENSLARRIQTKNRFFKIGDVPWKIIGRLYGQVGWWFVQKVTDGNKKFKPTKMLETEILKAIEDYETALAHATGAVTRKLGHRRRQIV